MNGEIRNQIEYEVYGEYGLFTDPLSKLGGEKMTMQIPSYEALKGITESIYWKPSITWIIDEVRIMNPIQMESKGIRPIDYGGGNTLANYTYLRRPKYQVRAHFIFNKARPDLQEDFNENKHHNIAKRCVKMGGRRDVFLGTRECQAYVEACTFGDGDGAYDEVSMDFSTMMHGITYPDEQQYSNMMKLRLWQPKMVNGVITFIKPEECELVRDLREFTPKEFVVGETMQSVDELYHEVVEK